jgi:hypothetical protein
VIGLLLVALLVATALIVAAAARLPSVVSTLLVAYLAFAANIGLVTIALSPAREVTRVGLAGAETVLLTVAIGAWWLRGRPHLPVAGVRPAVARIVSDPVTALFLVVVVVVLAYELVLVLTVPPNNWDSLTYHLARAAAWAQHGGVYWIPNAPTDRLNEFQPFAEQQNLFFFVATGSGALYALPQYLAELAILVAVYGTSRRLGFETRAAACSAFLLATFSLVVLEATTAQNDLVAASFPVAAACLLLGGGGVEPALAGLAVALGLGTKLTTSLVLPILAWLALTRGRRVAAQAAVGAATGFVAIGMWGFVLNLAHTGHLLGHGGGRVDDTASPAFPRSLETTLHVLYRMFDLSVLPDSLIRVLALVGFLAATALGVVAIRRGRSRRAAVLEATAVGMPLLSPLIVLGTAALFAYLTKQVHIPVRTSGFAGGIGRAADEDYSAFGPIGTAALLGVPLLTAVAYRAGRVGARRLALALALPVFLVLLGLQASYNPFLTRFLLVPAVLTAPLFGILFRTRAATAAILAVAAVSVTLTLAHDHLKPLHGAAGRPWRLTQVRSLEYIVWAPEVGPALAAYDNLVPPRACVGAIIGRDEPSYLLWGPRLRHHVVYLPSNGALGAAYRSGLFYVVVSPGSDTGTTAQFAAAGWNVRPLGGYWDLVVAPHAGSGECAAT